MKFIRFMETPGISPYTFFSVKEEISADRKKQIQREFFKIKLNFFSRAKNSIIHILMHFKHI